MPPDTSAGVITPGVEFERLMGHLRQCQEACANLSHLEHAMHSNSRKAELWLHMSELFKSMIPKVTELATRRMS